jgi:hypothetical protein
MLEAAQAGIDQIEEDPSLLTSKDNPLEDGSRLARDYGLTACGAEDA